MGHVAGFDDRDSIEGEADAAPGNGEAVPSAAVRYHDEQAADWDDKYLTGRFQRRSNFFLNNILPHLDSQGAWLDAGCGSGYFSRLLADRGNAVVGVDASEKMIESARSSAASNPSLRFEVIETVERLAFPDKSFQGALCLSVLEYLDEPKRCLSELERIIGPGGQLVLSLPHRRSPIRVVQRLANSLPDGIVPRRWRYAELSRHASTRTDVKASLRQHGFVVEKIAGFDSVLPPALLKMFAPSLIFVIARRV